MANNQSGFLLDVSGIQGGISFQAPAFSFGSGQAGADATGGLNFDLPLATVAQFTNSALTFAANNSQNNQGFLQGVIERQQAAVTRTSDQAFQYNNNALDTLYRMQAEQMSTARYIAKKSASGGCFITTAICKLDGKPDDCEELTKLRQFRDGYLSSEYPGGLELIKEYYSHAPAIVEAISVKPESEVHFAYLRDAFLFKALAQIELGEYKKAVKTYTQMFEVAQVIAGV